LILWLGLALAGTPDPEWGGVLAGLAGCASCHTADDGAPFAGGHAIETDFGTFYGSNITPDPEHGIGGWSFEDFERAMLKGVSPDGHAYWPAFPYPSFTGLSDDDLVDLWAYLQQVPADPRPDTPHEVGGRWRLPLWRLVAFRKGPRPAPDDLVLQRGAYLANAVGHCGECHTPRNGIGKVLWRRHDLEGTTEGPRPGPSLVALDWSDGDLETFLMMGMEPDGDFAGGGMGSIVAEGTSRLSVEDRAALIAWIRYLAGPT